MRWPAGSRVILVSVVQPLAILAPEYDTVAFQALLEQQRIQLTSAR